jgi:glycosyltransferase involved in cell wall biosynthesis
MSYKTKTKGFDITFVMTIYNQGWILEKIANHISKAAENIGSITTKFFLYGGNKIHHTFPKSNYVFYMHYSNFYHLAKKLDARTMVSPIIWFTHYDPNKEISIKQLVERCLEYNAIVLCPCSSNEELLVGNGFPRNRVSTILGGFDKKLLTINGERNHKEISFVSACYERKRPDLLISLVEKMQDYHFNIIGPHPDDIDNKDLLWSRSMYMEKIQKLTNVSLYEVSYDEYPDIISQSALYLMLSDFEGGPIGLIEAMALDLVPICTNTGFVSDLMTDNLAYGIVPLNPNLDMLSNTIRGADLTCRPREKVKAYDWESFAQKLVEYIFNNKEIDSDLLGNEKPFYYALSKEHELKEKGSYNEILHILTSILKVKQLAPLERSILISKCNYYKCKSTES